MFSLTSLASYDIVRLQLRQVPNHPRITTIQENLDRIVPVRSKRQDFLKVAQTPGRQSRCVGLM